MQPVMRAKTRVRADHARSRNAAIVEKRQNFRIEEVVSGTCIFVEVDDHFLSCTWDEHLPLISDKKYAIAAEEILNYS
jgi:hypothetical protein